MITYQPACPQSVLKICCVRQMDAVFCELHCLRVKNKQASLPHRTWCDSSMLTSCFRFCRTFCTSWCLHMSEIVTERRLHLRSGGWRQSGYGGGSHKGRTSLPLHCIGPSIDGTLITQQSTKGRCCRMMPNPCTIEVELPSKDMHASVHTLLMALF